MSNDLHCHSCGYPVHTSLASACPWCRSNADEITRLRARVEELEATLPQIIAMADEIAKAPLTAERWAERIEEVARAARGGDT